MKKTLVVADGIVARKFVELVKEKYFTNNHYAIVCKDEGLISAPLPTSFEVFVTDYTSRLRMSEIFSKNNITGVFIVLADAREQLEVYKIIRALAPQVKITMKLNLRDKIDKNALSNDENLVMIDSESVVANKIIERLPNVPIVPREFGLGQGEIMEIGVPFGSIFASRFIGQIEQNRWKIVGIYRKNELLLAHNRLLIHPNDTLLCAGEPSVLNRIYKQVNDDLGQFPAPFGRDICLYIDSSLCAAKAIFERLDDAFFLHKRLKNSRLKIHLFDSIAEARMESLVGEIELKIAQNNLQKSVEIKRERGNFCEIFLDNSRQKIGLIMMGSTLFGAHLKFLSSMNTPILKLGNVPLSALKSSFLALDKSINFHMASVMSDISKQLNLEMEIYEFEQNGAFNFELVKDFENIANLFEVKMKLLQSVERNPLLYVKKTKLNALEFLPLHRGISRFLPWAFFSNDTQRLMINFNHNPQIFIPIKN